MADSKVLPPIFCASEYCTMLQAFTLSVYLRICRNASRFPVPNMKDPPPSQSIEITTPSQILAGSPQLLQVSNGAFTKSQSPLIHW